MVDSLIVHFDDLAPSLSSLSYEPQLWGMVFPLAMYTTSTFQLSKALEVPFLTYSQLYGVYRNSGLDNRVCRTDASLVRNN
jgi:tellurite resistance protein TehA-like permease